MQTLWTGLAIASLVLSGALTARAAYIYPEKIYQQQWCNQFQGESETLLNDGTRADCITRNYAIEFDFAPKWAECLGQALHYSDLTGKRPACVLIIENSKGWKHYKKLRRSARKRAVKTWYMRPAQIRQR